MAVEVILSDIEGTTTSISFVHEVLFPLSFEKMSSYIEEHGKLQTISAEIDSIRMKMRKPDASLTEISDWLKICIKNDIKDTDLKSIQGKIWKKAYESGVVKGHMYSDVFEYFTIWKKKKLKLFIYSSGSIEAQKLIFQYSEFGDLTKLIDGYFDTNIGAKKEWQSYQKIAENIKTEPQKILFLSDIEDELNAAKKADFQTMQLVRTENCIPAKSHTICANFNEVNHHVT